MNCKRNLKEILKLKKGITLITLVITIIILVILAGITISQLTNSGLLGTSQKAKEEYQNAVNKENDQFKEMYSKILVADNSGSSLENVDMKTIKQLMLDTAYPIGSIYITIDDKNPATVIGGEWESVSSGRVLQGADENHAAGTTIEAGLPDHKHYGYASENDVNSSTSQGYPYNNNHKTYRTSDRGGNYYTNLDQSLASVYNGIYGNSDTVQPPAYVVHIWKRTK